MPSVILNLRIADDFFVRRHLHGVAAILNFWKCQKNTKKNSQKSKIAWIGMKVGILIRNLMPHIMVAVPYGSGGHFESKMAAKAKNFGQNLHSLFFRSYAAQMNETL